MNRAEESRRRRNALVLAGAGALLSLAALLRGLLVLWRPTQSWDTPELALDAALIAGGALLAVAGFAAYRRVLTAARATPATFLSAAEEREVIDAIRTFERDTSGEIRLHLCGQTGSGDVLAAARTAFEQLGMTATRERNGVLFFVAVEERRFAVLGDRGIDEKVPAGFWDGIVRDVQAEFAQGRFADGLVRGVTAAGRALASFFPPRPDDVNEMPDEISRTP